MKYEEVPFSAFAPQRRDHRVCRSAAQCQRREDRVEGYADPRWSEALVRWCSLCKKLTVTGRA